MCSQDVEPRTPEPPPQRSGQGQAPLRLQKNPASYKVRGVHSRIIAVHLKSRSEHIYNPIRLLVDECEVRPRAVDEAGEDADDERVG